MRRNVQHFELHHTTVSVGIWTTKKVYATFSAIGFMAVIWDLYSISDQNTIQRMLITAEWVLAKTSQSCQAASVQIKVIG
jgi:hypothetical protein